MKSFACLLFVVAKLPSVCGTALADQTGSHYRLDATNDRQTLVVHLTTHVSRDGNRLLNIGPKVYDPMPQPCVAHLEVIGRWIEVNDQQIDGNRTSLYKHEMSWGGLMLKDGRLYCILVQWPESGLFEMLGLENKVVAAGLLSSDDRLPFVQERLYPSGSKRLRVKLPHESPSRIAAVLWLEIRGKLRFEERLLPVSGGMFRFKPGL